MTSASCTLSRHRLHAGAVDVWLAVPDRASDLAEEASVLSPDERRRCELLRFPRDRLAYAVAHALLRKALSRYTNIEPAAWRFRKGIYGRPEIESPPCVPLLHFSLSHTVGLVACVIARSAHVGVDVEEVGRVCDPMLIAEQFFSTREVAELGALPQDVRRTRFCELWTLKEAYLKARGVGLGGSLAHHSFERRGRIISFFPDTSNDTSTTPWHFGLWAPRRAHRLAVAARSVKVESRGPIHFRFPDLRAETLAGTEYLDILESCS